MSKQTIFSTASRAAAQHADQLRQVLAVGADVPLRIEADALVGGAHAQALADIVLAVLAARQAAEIRALGLAQARLGALAQHRAQLREGGQVRVEAVREQVAVAGEQFVHVAQRGDVRIFQFQEGLARRHFLTVESDLAREVVDVVLEAVHGWPPAPRGRGRCWDLMAGWRKACDIY
jgi:hypothetical protein